MSIGIGKMNSITFGNSKIKYRIKKSPIRDTTQITVNNLGVQVTTPSKKTQKQIDTLIQKHAKWIYTKQLLAKEEIKFKFTFVHGSRLPFFGKNYFLDVKETKKSESFRLKNGKFVVRINKISKTRVRKLYLDWSKETSLPLLEKSVKKYSKKIGVEYGEILVKNQKNRWGSVSKKGTVNFNQKLIRAPPKIVDYVAAHEVCHLKIPNHSTSYWRLLKSIMPDYEERKVWLRINKQYLLN
jgi:predicted metal-dependent hydrolase